MKKQCPRCKEELFPLDEENRLWCVACGWKGTESELENKE